MRDVIGIIKDVLKIECSEIENKIEKIGIEYETAVNLLLNCKGKVVVTGIGKSGLVGQKIASTFSSTGTPSFFLHLAEGIHGDLGMIDEKDVLIAISYSGQTDELRLVLPAIKRMGVPLIAMTANPDSILARKADVILDIGVTKEACPLGLAPTASTTLTLAIGDALAVALLRLKNFDENDFVFRHPGGSLAKKLKKVADLMVTGSAVPIVSEDTLIKDVVYEMSSKKLGMTVVVDKENRVTGVVTDGDLRRMLEKATDISKVFARDIMTHNPKTIEEDALAAKAVKVMQDNKITSLIIKDTKGQAKGVIHLHKLLDEGIF